MRSDEEETSFGEELDMDRLLELLEDQTMPQSVQEQQQHDSDNLHDDIGETAIDHPLLLFSQTMQSIHRVPESDQLHDTIRQIGHDCLQSIHGMPESNHLHDTICQVGLNYLGQQTKFIDNCLDSDFVLVHGLPSPPVYEMNEELLDSDQPHDTIGQIEPQYLQQRIVLDFDPIDQESSHSSQSPPTHEPIIPSMDPSRGSFWDSFWGDIRFHRDHESGHSSQSPPMSPPMHESIILPMNPSHGPFWDDIRFHGDQESGHSSQSPPMHELIIPPMDPSHGDQESGHSSQLPPMHKPIIPPMDPWHGSFWDDIRSINEMMDHFMEAQQENHLAEVELLNDLSNDSQIGGNPPASQSVANNLPSVAVAENTLCAVCGDKISLQEVAAQLPCLHEYHKECILPWLGIRNSCLVCRYELPTDDPEYERSKRRTDAEV